MHVCHQCGFVFNATFDPALLDYGSDYDNSLICSTAFENHLDELVAYLLYDRRIQQSQIIEIGCGKGTFLRKLVANQATGNQAVGFDPSYFGPESDLSGRLRFVKQFFDGTRFAVQPDVVICRHVLEHIKQPVTFLKTLNTALKVSGSLSTRVFFETPCVEWILSNQVAWDFFYEHCSLFNSSSLAQTFQQAGFEVARVKHLFGGQYLWIEANWSQNLAQAATPDPGALPGLAEQFSLTESQQWSVWIREIARLRQLGRIALWGAGAKGVTFANRIDPDGQLLEGVVDVNLQKQGKFLPGTGHSIIAPEQLGDYGISTALVLNSNYVAEIQRTLQALKSPVLVFDLMGAISHKQGGFLAA